MLQKSNQHEPVINPKIGYQIGSKNYEEAPLVDAEGDTGKPKEYPESGNHDLVIVMGGKHRRRGVEVCRNQH